MSAHVFLSYVRENAPWVDRIKSALEDAGAVPWLDRERIGAGVRWEQVIRNAIVSGTYFVACFSAESHVRQDSYMTREVQIAIGELQRRPTDRAWFIPIKLSPCDIPQRSISANETLGSLNCLELFPEWEPGMRRLIAAVSRRSPTEAGAPQMIAEQHSVIDGVEGDTLSIKNIEGTQPGLLATSEIEITNSHIRDVAIANVTNGRRSH